MTTLETAKGVVVQTDLSGDEVMNRLTLIQSGQLRHVSQRTRQFAADLLAASRRKKGMSHDQWVWAHKLALEAVSPPTAPDNGPQPVSLGGGIPALFATASSRLQRPALTFALPSGTIRLALAGERSNRPGTINVTSVDRECWFGRIAPDGSFEPSRGSTDEVVELLRELSVDPAKAAADYGKRTGNCCFCHIKLTDPRSVDVGYGPVCADNWGLPWGDVSGKPRRSRKGNNSETVAA